MQDNVIHIKVRRCSNCGKLPIVKPSSIGCKQCGVYFITVDSIGMKQVARNWNKMQIMENEKVRFADLRVGDIFQFNYVKWLKISPIHINTGKREGPTEVNALSLEFPMIHADIGPERLCIPGGNVKKLTQ